VEQNIQKDDDKTTEVEISEEDKKSALEALKIGTHLYAKDKQMSGWVLIPKEHTELWREFTKKAIDFVETLKK